MNLKEQLYVCTLAELGSISKAAEKLYITQPALSLYISNLEKNIGAKLFTRRKNRFVLTYIGEKYVEKAWQMLKLQNEFNIELSDLAEGILGRLRIGIQLRRSPYIVVEISKVFRHSYPNIELVFEESDIKELERMMEENQIDLMIYSCGERKEDLDYIHVYDDNILVAINSSSKLRRKAKWLNDYDELQYIDLKDLEGETFILTQKGQSLRENCDVLFKEDGIKPKKFIEIRNLETIMRLVSEDFGIGFNRKSYIRHMSHIKNIIYLNIKQSKIPSELVIAYPKGTDVMPNFQSMVNSIKQVLIENE